MIYNEGDRYLFNSCCQHSTGGVVRVSLCPLASPRKVLTEHSVAVRQTRKEFLQFIWWGREELFMPITTPQNSTTTFHSKTQFAETCSSRSRKFLGKYSNHVTGSRFCLQSSKHSPSHWPTETNPGHLSRPSSNLPSMTSLLSIVTPLPVPHSTCNQSVPRCLCWRSVLPEGPLSWINVSTGYASSQLSCVLNWKF